MALVELGDFKGNAMLVLKAREDSEYPFQFGQKKAQLIIQHLSAVRRFAEFGDVLAESVPQPEPPVVTDQAATVEPDISF